MGITALGEESGVSDRKEILMIVAVEDPCRVCLNVILEEVPQSLERAEVGAAICRMTCLTCSFYCRLHLGNRLLCSLEFNRDQQTGVRAKFKV
jgi:hypothetical protein